MTDDRLEAALRDLGGHLDVPDMPDVTAAVRAGLMTEQPRRSLRPVLATVLALLLAFALAFAVSPEVRAGVSDFLKFAGIGFTSDPPPPLPSPTTDAMPPLLPGEQVVTLDQAREKFPVIVPKRLGLPKEVHVGERVVSLLYENARVDEFNGTISGIMTKFVHVDQLEQVTVNGVDGYWVNGPHEVIYDDPRGNPRTEAPRLAGRTLIWQVGTTTLRLEGDFTKEQAVAIAEAGQS
jgi:hypothetical protein